MKRSLCWCLLLLTAYTSAYAEEPLDKVRDAARERGTLTPLPPNAMQGVRVSRVRPLLLRGDHARMRVRTMMTLGVANQKQAVRVMNAAVARLKSLGPDAREIELLNAGILLGALPALPKDTHPALRAILKGRSLPAGLGLSDVVALSGDAYLGIWDRAQHTYASAKSPAQRREILHFLVGMWTGLTAVTLDKTPLMDAAPMGETLRAVIRKDAVHGKRDIALEQRVQRVIESLKDGVQNQQRFDALESITQTPPAQDPGNG